MNALTLIIPAKNEGESLPMFQTLKNLDLNIVISLKKKIQVL